MSSYSGIDELSLNLTSAQPYPPDLVSNFYEIVIPRHSKSLHTLHMNTNRVDWGLRHAFIPAISACRHLRDLKVGVYLPPDSHITMLDSEKSLVVRETKNLALFP
jgi:hypothetical protein